MESKNSNKENDIILFLLAVVIALCFSLWFSYSAVKKIGEFQSETKRDTSVFSKTLEEVRQTAERAEDKAKKTDKTNTVVIEEFLANSQERRRVDEKHLLIVVITLLTYVFVSTCLRIVIEREGSKHWFFTRFIGYFFTNLNMMFNGIYIIISLVPYMPLIVPCFKFLYEFFQQARDYIFSFQFATRIAGFWSEVWNGIYNGKFFMKKK